MTGAPGGLAAPTLRPLPTLTGLPGLPGRRRGLLAVLLALLLLLGWVVWNRQRPPQDLQSAQLVGLRGPGCVRLAVLPDMSGSMVAFAAARQVAVTQVLQWAPANLRSDDELVVIPWATTAQVALPVTTVPAMPSARVRQVPLVADDSRLLPALQQLAAQPDSRCRTVAAVVSDGLIYDDSPKQLLTALQHAHVDHVVLLRPDEDLAVPGEWKHLLPYAPSNSFNGLDPDATGLAFGNVLADATGQTLQRR